MEEEGTFAPERLDEEGMLELVVREAARRRKKKARLAGDRPRKKARTTTTGPGPLQPATAVFFEHGVATDDIVAAVCAALQLRRVTQTDCHRGLHGLSAFEVVLLWWK